MLLSLLCLSVLLAAAPSVAAGSQPLACLKITGFTPSSGTPGTSVTITGCGFGPILKAVQERGGHGVGLTLSRKQAEVSKRAGLEAYAKNWKEVTIDTFGMFDGIVSVGAFEHFCSPEEYVAGNQDAIYDHFFRLCHDLLPVGGSLYLQTMILGKNAPALENISLQAVAHRRDHRLSLQERGYPRWRVDRSGNH